MSITVNYDQLAATYNQRFSGDSQSGVLSFLLELANRLQARRQFRFLRLLMMMNGGTSLISKRCVVMFSWLRSTPRPELKFPC
jgi:hypothetical protein